MKQAFKKLYLSEWVHRSVSWLIALYLRFVWITSKWDYQGADELRTRAAEDKGLFILCWHERVSIVPLSWQKHYGELSILNSAHRDGLIVTRVMESFGIKSIPVTSKGNNLAAARAVINIMNDGGTIGITPDGPRGPRREMKLLPLQWARMTGATLSICTYSVKRKITLNSWDKFILPLPFNRGTFIWKTLGELPKDLTDDALEAERAKLETALSELTDEVDGMGW